MERSRFCGSLSEKSNGAAVVYRMDLDTHTHEVASVITILGLELTDLNNVSVYEDKLYVASGYAQQRIGFELDENGMVRRRGTEGLSV